MTVMDTGKEEKMEPAAGKGPLADESQPEVESMEAELEYLRKQVETEQRKSNEQANRMKYLQADLINLQRQADRMVSEARSQVKLTWIMEVISIKEDLQRALNIAGSNESLSLIDGLKLVMSKIDNTLKSENVESIVVELGASFDPRLHEAIAYKETTEIEEGKVLSVISPGYTVAGRVLKPSMVEVARRPGKLSSSTTQSQEVVPRNNSKTRQEMDEVS